MRTPRPIQIPTNTGPILAFGILVECFPMVGCRRRMMVILLRWLIGLFEIEILSLSTGLMHGEVEGRSSRSSIMVVMVIHMRFCCCGWWIVGTTGALGVIKLALFRVGRESLRWCVSIQRAPDACTDNIVHINDAECISSVKKLDSTYLSEELERPHGLVHGLCPWGRRTPLVVRHLPFLYGPNSY